MLNKTSATLMLQTIMVLIEKQNSTRANVTNFPHLNVDDMELERCYGKYGCFSIAYPWTENRPENYFPYPPDFLHVRYPTFSRRNRVVPVMLLADNKEKMRNANISPKGPFYLISHGFLDSGEKIWIQEMMNRLLDLEGNADATVIVVDWRGGSQPPYTQAVANIRLIGVMTAHFIHNLYEVLGLTNLDNFHYIGHSLGAHLGGYCGHTLQKKYGLKLARITGLDPAAPCFSNTVSIVRLDRSDASYVDVIHSNGLPLYWGGLGMVEAIGHVDFFPNGGMVQPGCEQQDAPAAPSDDLYRSVSKHLGCNHQRSYEYFSESISPSCPFMAIQCNSYESFLDGNCTSCDSKHYCMPIGYHSYIVYKRLQMSRTIDPNSNIALFSQTGTSRPFCRVNYEIVLKIANSSESVMHGPDVGKVAITLLDKNNGKSDQKYLDDDVKYYKPGDVKERMLPFKGFGQPPSALLVEWIHETNLFNPITWRLLKSSSVFIEYIKVASIEYNTVITVCPKQRKPVVASSPTIMKAKYCNFNN